MTRMERVAWILGAGAALAAALTACGRNPEQTTTSSVKERTFMPAPASLPLEAAFPTGRVQDLRVTEHVGRGAGKDSSRDIEVPFPEPLKVKRGWSGAPSWVACTPRDPLLRGAVAPAGPLGGRRPGSAMGGRVREEGGRAAPGRWIAGARSSTPSVDA